MSAISRSVRRLFVAGAVLASMLVGAAAANAQVVSLTTQPSLQPAFSASVSDYVIRCTGAPVQVSVSSSGSSSVNVDGQGSRKGSFTATVNVTTGQGFAVVAHGPTQTWYFRCLPTDFPNFTATVSGTPQAQFYLTAPLAASAFSATPPATNYVAIFDDNLVPIWWKATSTVPVYARVDQGGNVAWTDHAGGAGLGGGVATEANLDGTTVRTISSPDGPIDFHELQQFPNGDYLVEVDTTRCCFNLSSWASGAPSSATIYDQLIEELSPSGSVVWSWDPATHINPAIETDPEFRSTVLAGGSPYDVYHMNSLAVNTNGDVVVSFRNLDAVYDVSKANGGLVWKLGGQSEPESLKVLNDPVFSAGGDFGGQHDARVLPNGTITIHDNATGRTHHPRAVHYKINLTARTATLAGSITDPLVTQSVCCGSASLLPEGDWVVAWGDQSFFTELTPSRSRVFKLQWNDKGTFSYRVEPILSGVYTAAQLRAGMNAQYPR